MGGPHELWLADLAGADWVCDPAKRSARIDELYRAVAAITPSKTTAEWLALLKTLDVPSAPVNSLDELFDEEHLNAVGFFQDMAHPTEGPLRVARTPFRVAGVAPEPDLPPPNLGEATDSILADAGYSAAEVAEMRAKQIVR